MKSGERQQPGHSEIAVVSSPTGEADTPAAVAPRRNGMRQTELRRGKPLRKRTKNRAKTERDFARQFHSEERVRAVQMMPSVFSSELPCVNMHGSRGRGAGGTYLNVVPATKAEHDRAHQIGILSFLREQGKSMTWLIGQERETQRRWEAYQEAWG